MSIFYFRGLTIYGDWVYGNVLEDGETYVIVEEVLPDEFGLYVKRHQIVSRDSIGRFTGNIDKRGSLIFEDDIVKFELDDTIHELSYKKRGRIVFRKNSFLIMSSEEDLYYRIHDPRIINLEVVGNILDGKSFKK